MVLSLRVMPIDIFNDSKAVRTFWGFFLKPQASTTIFLYIFHFLQSFQYWFSLFPQFRSTFKPFASMCNVQNSPTNRSYQDVADELSWVPWVSTWVCTTERICHGMFGEQPKKVILPEYCREVPGNQGCSKICACKIHQSPPLQWFGSWTFLWKTRLGNATFMNQFVDVIWAQHSDVQNYVYSEWPALRVDKSSRRAVSC